MTDAWFSPGTAVLFSYLSLLSLCSLIGLEFRMALEVDAVVDADHRVR